MCGKRARTLHVGTFFNDNFCLDEDLTLLRRSRTSPHDVLIEESFGRAKLTDLNSVSVCSCHHHNNTIKNTRYTASDFRLALFCSDWLYVHDCVGVCVIHLRCDDIDL